MHNVYFGIIFASAVALFVMGLMLFFKRHEGERSRLMLSLMMFISSFSYIYRIAELQQTLPSIEVLSPQLLLMGFFVITTYIIYPIEVISPGWLNRRRLAVIFSPTILLWITYYLSLFFGAKFVAYHSVSQMLDDVASFQAIFRLLLVVLNFIPVLLLWFVPYTRRYNNTDNRWMVCYVVVVLINMVAYLLVISDSSIFVRSFYYLVTVLCSVYIFYQEMFIRLIAIRAKIDFTNSKLGQQFVDRAEYRLAESKERELFCSLEAYAKINKIWRDPDLSMAALAENLHTNRRILLTALQIYGFDGYSSYINKCRIDDFISLINSGEINTYQDAFYEVGFRSRATALRNFKYQTGYNPSEYFNPKK